MSIPKLAAIAVAIFCFHSTDAKAATAQSIFYGLTATSEESLSADELAALAVRLLDSEPADPAYLTPNHAALLLAARNYNVAADAYQSLGCDPGPDQSTSRICFLGASSRSTQSALGDQLAWTLRPLNPVAKERVFAWLRGREAAEEASLNRLLAQFASASAIDRDSAVQIVEAALVLRAVRAAGPSIDDLISQQRQSLYEIDASVLIQTPEGVTLSATLVRPRNALEVLPTAMWFTIYSDRARNLEIASEAAAHGYAGLVVNARGKLDSDDDIRPYEVETFDTVAAIDWASTQSWSDGRVGMYGGSYTGFAAWAATKRLPEALKTIVPYVAAIPGQGLPMENNVFLNANYGWPFFVATNRTLNRSVYNDPDRWSSLNERWYQSGQPYRDIDQLDDVPNPWLQRWLEHPSYDAYWQAMVPYGEDFAQIDIPILSITGYYDDGQISALQYLKEHYRYRPDAEHYLVIGPYDHFGAQSSYKPKVLREYQIDPVAQFDTSGLTFAWFDHVFRGEPRPELLADRINYEVMGANVWRHAPSLDAMAETHQRFYLSDAVSQGHFSLSGNLPSDNRHVSQTVDFADRTTSSAGYYPFPVENAEPDFSAGLVFQTEPLTEEIEISGGLSGELHVRTNKRDFDFMAALYEVREDSSSFALSYYLGRASYARDISERELLNPNAINLIPFDRSRINSRRVSKGSRLVLVIDVISNNFHEVNYGTGGNVADESITDASTPLAIDWLTSSFIDVPFHSIN